MFCSMEEMDLSAYLWFMKVRIRKMLPDGHGQVTFLIMSLSIPLVFK